MAFGTGGGGLFDKPADNQPTLEELQRQVAVLEEKNKSLQDQNKIQRDSWLQLNQHHAEQSRINRELLAQQVRTQHPTVAPSAPAQPPASDSWADMVNSIAGGAPQQPSAPAPALTPDILKQAVRQVIHEETSQADQMQAAEKNFLAETVNAFKIQYPELAGNQHFVGEANRAYTELRQQGIEPQQAWNLSLREAAHIHNNYRPRQQQQSKEQQPSAQQQQVPGAQYIFPMGMTGAGGGQQRGNKQNDNLIIDMRPPEERFKDASADSRASREELANRFYGITPQRR